MHKRNGSYSRQRENSGLNPTLPLLKPSKEPDDKKETISIKICIDDTVSKDYKTNYETNIFKAIKTFGYNGTSIVDMLCAIKLDIFTSYALNIPLLLKKGIRLFFDSTEGYCKN